MEKDGERHFMVSLSQIIKEITIPLGQFFSGKQQRQVGAAIVAQWLDSPEVVRSIPPRLLDFSLAILEMNIETYFRLIIV